MNENETCRNKVILTKSLFVTQIILLQMKSVSPVTEKLLEEVIRDVCIGIRKCELLLAGHFDIYDERTIFKLEEVKQKNRDVKDKVSKILFL